MGTVSLEQVSRRFGTHIAVDDLSLTVQNGEFLVLLGPSGCGKTTSLRMLAGLEQPTSGLIRIDSQIVNDIPPGRRDIGMVFQSYALYPHMTVYRNLVFGPRIRGENREATDRAVRDIAEVLGLAQLLDRRPSELSGGQRQRVALGRALLRHPKLFLMDEPLSNLDAALRGQVRTELVRLHRKFGITTVYVTHDQIEAMTMANQIAIMSHGRLQQAGAPQDVFDDPVNETVARFVGSPPMNILPGSLRQEGGRLIINLLGHDVTLPAWAALAAREPPAGEVRIGIRPTDIGVDLSESGAGPAGEIGFVESLGAETYLTIASGRTTLICRAPGRMRLLPGDTVGLTLDPHHLYAFDPETGSALLDRSARRGTIERDNTRRASTQHSDTGGF
jgi:ABC-type sugar transport system ATPase subunit